MPLRVSLVNLQKLTFQAWLDTPSARAKDAVLAAGDDDAAHVGVLKADAVERVMQLNVHPQVVAVELELVARTNPTVLRNVEGQPCNGALDRQGPVAVLRGIGAVVNAFGSVGEVCHEVSVENSAI